MTKSKSRHAFDSSLRFQSTLPPNPSWTSGQGTNGIDQNDDGTATAAAASSSSYTVIEPGKTAIETKMLYRVMLGGISPRPIAFVGTYGRQDGSDVANLAPISWYNMVSHDPPLVMISFGGIRERIKDSERNILTQKQFTISCCTEAYAEAVNHAAINAPSGTSEFALTGLTPVPGRLVHAPRVGEAPFSMELTLEFTKQWDNDAGDHTTTMIVGRVKLLYVRNDIKDEEGCIDPAALRPISRFSGTTYGRSTIGFDLTLPRWENVKDTMEVQSALTNPRTAQRTVEEPIAERYPC